MGVGVNSGQQGGGQGMGSLMSLFSMFGKGGGDKTTDPNASSDPSMPKSQNDPYASTLGNYDLGNQDAQQRMQGYGQAPGQATYQGGGGFSPSNDDPFLNNLQALQRKQNAIQVSKGQMGGGGQGMGMLRSIAAL